MSLCQERGIAWALREWDGETGSTFFFLLYAATIGKCLQERGELEQHEITPGQSWQPAKGSIKPGEPYHPLHTTFNSQETDRRGAYDSRSVTGGG